jgi:hypothetical protein
VIVPVLCRVQRSGRFLGVVLEQSLNFIFEPVPEVVEIFMLQKLLCSRSILRVKSEAFTSEGDRCVVLEAAESVFKRAAWV